MSCFICEVMIDDDMIELINSGHQSFFIDKNNDNVMKIFKEWFKDVYKACIPQTLTIIQYDVVNKEDERMLVVENLIYSKNNKIICE